MLEDQLGNVLHGRIVVADEHRFAERTERFQQRVVAPQDHPVVELPVDPSLDDALDLSEITDHLPIVQRLRPHLNLRDRVVSVRVLADPVVIEQPMTITEVDALGYGIHLTMVPALGLASKLTCVALVAQAFRPARLKPRRTEATEVSPELSLHYDLPMVVDASKTGQDAAATAVLCSGGLDSAVLVASERTRVDAAGHVQPIYVSSGMAWEACERETLALLLSSPAFAGVRPLAYLECPVADAYPATHWALRGDAPAYDTPDEDVYLVGRNVLLLAKVSAYCAINGVTRIALGPLAGNPFPDASSEFFDAMEHALSLGLAREIRIVAPFGTLGKADVVTLGRTLGVPFELTISCMNPVPHQRQGAAHCGRCSKCRERLQAFDAAGLADPALYAFRPQDARTGA